MKTTALRTRKIRHTSLILSLLMLAVSSPSSSLADPAPNSQGWVEFTSFVYEGRDGVFDQAPPSPTEFYNPILSGFYPDPSICRVGDDYYLIHSTFSYFPGIPIFHSTDLVNWTQLGHVLDRRSQLNLEGLPVSSGIFAPAISHHNGLFYVITTNIRGGGNFYVTASNPRGPWSDPVRLPRVNGIDPSFFFDDDGRVFIVHNGPPPEDKPLYSGHRAVWMWEFDLQAKEVKGDGRIIVNGGTDLSKEPSWIEGPHIYKRNGFYYLCAAEGGTGPGHSQVIFRSRSVEGPYEPFSDNPILTQRGLDRERPNPVTSVGHADLVETQAGEWWAVFLGVRPYEGNYHNTGRETLLLPVTWENDWPLILKRGEVVPRVMKRPKLPAAPTPDAPLTGTFTWRDDFDSERLALPWIFLRNPDDQWWTLKAKPGSLLIAPRPVPLHSIDKKDPVINGNPSFIARRQQHIEFSATATVDVSAVTTPSEAGLAALQNDSNYFFLGVRVEGGLAREVFLERHTNKSSGIEILAQASLSGDPARIDLKVESDGPDYTFSYRAGAVEGWTPLSENVDGRILSSHAAGGFVGTCLGMYARLSQ